MLTMIDSLSTDGQLLVGLIGEVIKIKEKLESNAPHRLYFKMVVGSEKFGGRFYVGVEKHYKSFDYWKEKETEETCNDSLGYIYIKNLNTPKIEAFIEKIIEKLVKDYGYTV